MSDRLVEVITTDPEFPCAVCGFDPGQIHPPAAAAAARSFGRRWREMLAAGDGDHGAIARQLDDSGWSSSARAERVALVLDAEGGALNLIWLRDRPVLDRVAPRPSPPERDIDEVLAALTTAGEFLARRIEDFGMNGWDRTGVRDGHPVTALHLVREAIHEAVHHLRLAADGLESRGVHQLERDGD